MIHETKESIILGRRVMKIASRSANEMDEYSTNVDHHRELSIPRLHRDEIMVSKLLGRGGYNDVYEIHEIRQARKQEDQNTEEQQQKRNALVIQASKGNFAIKYLSQTTMNNPDRFISGAADLVIESKLLANLSHPNIVTLHAVSSDGIKGFRHIVEGNFFIVTDKLECTLLEMLEKWNRQHDCLTKQLQTSSNHDRPLRSAALRDLFHCRLKVVADLAKAVGYLHSKKIIFRDLKGENIGFDKNGILKLFDFGLAKELDPQERLDDNTYKMSGMTGTRRYMAPEVLSNKPYNLTADTYSYCIVIWEILSLRQAYSGMSATHHLHHVVINHGRPSVDPYWPPVLSTLITCGWHADLSKRPDMTMVSSAMEKCLETMQKPAVHSVRGHHGKGTELRPKFALHSSTNQTRGT